MWFAGTAGAIAVAVAFSWPCVRNRYSLSDTVAYVIAVVVGDVRTRYAVGFSEQVFAQIRVGMTSGEVRAILGEPLGRFPPSGQRTGTLWRYADQVSGTDHFHLRDISFSGDDRVEEIIKGFYFD